MEAVCLVNAWVGVQERLLKFERNAKLRTVGLQTI